jgi:ATP-binding cassette, subfamily C (CFTR/MRP), member 1
MVTWFAVHGKWILAGVIPRIFQIGFTFSQPLLVEAAVAFAATPDETRYNNLGYGLIGAYAIIYTGIAVRQQIHTHTHTHAHIYIYISRENKEPH